MKKELVIWELVLSKKKNKFSDCTQDWIKLRKKSCRFYDDTCELTVKGMIVLYGERSASLTKRAQGKSKTNNNSVDFLKLNIESVEKGKQYYKWILPKISMKRKLLFTIKNAKKD
jgi:hypothetical protein